MSANLTRYARYLPDPDNLVGALGFRRAQPPALLAAWGLFGAGLLLGSAVALLLTPRSGAELRSDIRDRVVALRDRVRSPRPDGEDHDGALA